MAKMRTVAIIAVVLAWNVVSLIAQSDRLQMKSNSDRRTFQQQIRIGSFANESELWRYLMCFFDLNTDDSSGSGTLVMKIFNVKNRK